MRPRSYFKNKTSFAWFALTDLDFVFIILSTTHIPPILKHCKISVSHFWRIPDAIKNVTFFISSRRIDSVHIVPLLQRRSSRNTFHPICINRRLMSLDNLSVLTHAGRTKKVLILVKCNDYKIGVSFMYNVRNSDLYHIKNMNRLFPRPWSWTPSRKIDGAWRKC